MSSAVAVLFVNWLPEMFNVTASVALIAPPNASVPLALPTELLAKVLFEIVSAPPTARMPPPPYVAVLPAIELLVILSAPPPEELKSAMPPPLPAELPLTTHCTIVALPRLTMPPPKALPAEFFVIVLPLNCKTPPALLAMPAPSGPVLWHTTLPVTVRLPLFRIPPPRPLEELPVMTQPATARVPSFQIPPPP